jgi:hypothetical protein
VFQCGHEEHLGAITYWLVKVQGLVRLYREVHYREVECGEVHYREDSCHFRTPRFEAHQR